MTRKTTGKKANPEKKRKKKEPSLDGGGSSAGTAAQNSEYRDLRKRIDARKDAQEILKIAKSIENEP